MSQSHIQNTPSVFFIFKEIKQEGQSISAKAFKCTYQNCSKEYSHKNKMIAHLRTHYNIKPFKCNFCDKCFNERGNLKTHIRIHTGERPYHCNQCPKSFKAFGQLKDHLSSHTGIKPFQCPICKKFYRRKGILKNHIFIHSTGPQKMQKKFKKIVSCNQCKLKFKTEKKLNVHLLSHLSTVVEDSKRKQSVLSEESSTNISSSISMMSNITKSPFEMNDEEYFNKNSICDEIFNILQNDMNNSNRNNRCKLFECNDIVSDENDKESCCLATFDINF